MAILAKHRKYAAHFTPEQELLVANLWVILGLIICTALLLLPLQESPVARLLGGFAPYMLSNIYSLYLAYKGRLRASLVSYTAVVFICNFVVIILLTKLPPHMVLNMIQLHQDIKM